MQETERLCSAHLRSSAIQPLLAWLAIAAPVGSPVERSVPDRYVDDGRHATDR